ARRGHIVEGCTGIQETVGVYGGGQPVTVFSLGTAKSGKTNNIPSAVDVLNEAVYVGYCGYCDILTGGLPFDNGIATNVSGGKPARIGTGDGWHLARRSGLPTRFITSVKMDPSDHRTIYVTLGGYGRRWIPPGSLGDTVARVGAGHLFKSTDAGDS